MAVITTGITAGVAPGALVAGVVIDRFGASPSYWVAATAGIVGFLAGLFAERPRPDVSAPQASPSGSSA
jgi:predicted MFS family arabinose efflux permease